MRQAFHIFAKDVRRFYPEILASLIVTLAFVSGGELLAKKENSSTDCTSNEP